MQPASLDQDGRFSYPVAAMDRPLTTAVCGAGVLLVVLTSAIGSGGEPAAEDSAPATSPAIGEEGVLVLHSGGVVVGKLSRDGDRYLVVGAKSQLRVATADVAIACRTLGEAYEIKRRQIVAPTADAHLDLAEWCLRHNLTGEAARELAYIHDLEPGHPRLALVERRLAVAKRPPRPVKPKPSDEEPLSSTPGAKVSGALDPNEALARKLPDAIVERFTRKVQPVLVHNCTTSGCHQQNGDEEFQLDRAILHGTANRRSTIRNLAATLALVDNSSPHLSPLLTAARRAHGGSEEAPLGPREAQQFEQLVEWVALVNQEAKLPTVSAPQVAAGQGGKSATPQGVVQAHYEAIEPLRPLAEQEQRVQYGAKLKPTGPADPFDPEEFNRRYSTGSAAQQPPSPR